MKFNDFSKSPLLYLHKKDQAAIQNAFYACINYFHDNELNLGQVSIVADALMSSITKANSNLTFEENHKMASMRYELETRDNIMNLLIRDDVNEYVKQKINAKKGQKENIDTSFVDAQATQLSGYKNPWVMVDANTGEVIDDGNGYGFRSEENAIKHYTYTRGNKY